MGITVFEIEEASSHAWTLSPFATRTTAIRMDDHRCDKAYTLAGTTLGSNRRTSPWRRVIG